MIDNPFDIKDFLKVDLDNLLNEMKLAIPQMKDPFGKINEDNKYESLRNEIR
jgi:hypothetical protein